MCLKRGEGEEEVKAMDGQESKKMFLAGNSKQKAVSVKD